jgi:hypothetical protein
MSCGCPARPLLRSPSARAARSAFSLAAPALMSSPRILTPIVAVSRGQRRESTFSRTVRAEPRRAQSTSELPQVTVRKWAAT